MFESQTKTKLGSNNMWPEGPTVNKYVGDFIKTEVDNYLHKKPVGIRGHVTKRYRIPKKSVRLLPELPS